MSLSSLSFSPSKYQQHRIFLKSVPIRLSMLEMSCFNLTGFWLFGEILLI